MKDNVFNSVLSDFQRKVDMICSDYLMDKNKFKYEVKVEVEIPERLNTYDLQKAISKSVIEAMMAELERFENR